MTSKQFTIKPYLLDGVWVFDDEAVGLKQEPFVCGASEMISEAVYQKVHLSFPFVLPSKCTLTFSAEQLDKCDVHLKWQPAPSGSEAPLSGGNWYNAIIGGRAYICWLCPALFRYFDLPPTDIFVRIEQC